MRALLTLLALATVVQTGWAQILREEVTLAVWDLGDSRQRKVVLDAVAGAQRSRAGLIVNCVSFPGSDPYRQIQQWCQPGARGVPDLVVVRDAWLPDFAASFSPLNALLNASDLRPIPESVRARLRHAGNLYGVPWQANARALFYRSDLFAQAGLLAPRNWGEVLVAARRLHAPPTLWGFGLPGVRDSGAAQLLLNLLWSAGVDLPGPGQTPLAFPTEALTAAMRTYQELHGVAEPEVLSWDQDDLEEQFLNRRVAMLVGDKHFQDRIAGADPAFPAATAPLPTDTGPVGHISVDLVCLFSGSAHRDAAVHVLRSLTGYAPANHLLALGGIPCQSQVIADNRLRPAYASYLAAIEQAKGLPRERWEGVRDSLDEGLLYLLTGRKTPAEAVEIVRQRLYGAAAAAPSASLKQ
jgi:ABC-type glycerol-3-phosphate transport system substrate-binding protein